MKASFKFYQNRDCQYFPCHDIDEDKMNCLFCYCPLYALKEKCGGQPKFLESGIKSCENCTKTHNGEEAWDYVASKMKDVLELGKLKNE